MQQIYRRTPMSKCDFNKVAIKVSIKVAKQLYSNRTSAWVFSCKLLHIFRTPFLKKTSEGLLLQQSNHINTSIRITLISIGACQYFIKKRRQSIKRLKKQMLIVFHLVAMKLLSEAITRRCSMVKISQNSQDTPVPQSLL